MANVLIDTANTLGTIDYTQILQKITQNIHNINIETTKNYTQITNLHKTINNIIADLKAEHITTSKILDIDFSKRPNHLSINYNNYDNFSANIKKLYKTLQINSLKDEQLSKLDSIKKIAKVDINFGLDYNFDPKKITKKSMSLAQCQTATTEKLRVDTVEIKINTKEVENQFKENIITQLSNYIDDEEDLEDKIEQVEEGRGNVNNVINSVNNDCLARIKRTISYLYLEYLLENFQGHPIYNWAKNYINRFKILEAYLQELILRPESESTVQIGQNFP